MVDHVPHPFGVAPTGLPIIETVPGMKNVFTVTGFGGNGIAFSQIASQLGEAAAGESREGFPPVRLRPRPGVAQGGLKETRRQ